MRRKARFSVVLAVAIAGVGVWGGLQVFAASSAQPPPASAYQLKTGKAPTRNAVPNAPVQNPGATPPLIGTYLYQVGYGPATGSGFPVTTVEGPDTITCHPPTGLHGHCLLEVDKVVQVYGPAGSKVAAITFVDGDPSTLTGQIDPGYFMGTTDGTYYKTFTVHSDCPETYYGFCTVLSYGTHSIIETVYTDQPSQVGGAWFEVRLYAAP
jgi:hypothetical protein